MKKVFMVLFSLSLLLAACSQTKTTNYEDFAKCLTEKGVIMYGASWCGHCAKQKAMFGDSFQFINYVECDDNGKQASVCVQAGIRGYPTWMFKNGKKVEGEATVVDLSENSGCSLDLIQV